MNKIKQIGAILNANKFVILRRTAILGVGVVAVTVAGGLIRPQAIGAAAEKAAEVAKKVAE